MPILRPYRGSATASGSGSRGGGSGVAKFFMDGTATTLKYRHAGPRSEDLALDPEDFLTKVAEDHRVVFSAHAAMRIRRTTSGSGRSLARLSLLRPNTSYTDEVVTYNQIHTDTLVGTSLAGTRTIALTTLGDPPVEILPEHRVRIGTVLSLIHI